MDPGGCIGWDWMIQILHSDTRQWSPGLGHSLIYRTTGDTETHVLISLGCPKNGLNACV